MFRWIRRSDHPSRPNAMTCCFFSSLKTLLTLTEGIALASRSMSRTLLIVGRFSGDHVWPVLGVHRGVTPLKAVEGTQIVMTVQIKRFIELSDILALRFTCKNCGVTLSFPIEDNKLKRDNLNNQFLDVCQIDRKSTRLNS